VVLFHTTHTLGVRTLQSFSPLLNSTKLVTWRYPLNVYPISPEGNWMRSQGLMFSSDPFSLREYCIPRRVDALLGLFRFRGFPCLSLATPLGATSAHDLLFRVVQARL
jgi:hypothetical protein